MLCEQYCAYATRILEDIEIAGVENLADSAVILRSRIHTQPLAQWDVRRAFFKRIKEAFEAEGIEIPLSSRILNLSGPAAGALGWTPQSEAPSEKAASRWSGFWRREPGAAGVAGDNCLERSATTIVSG